MATKDVRLWDCERCGFQYKKSDLRKNKGLLVCKPCYDDVRENKGIDLKIRFSPRDNATTLTAVTSPTIYTITAATSIPLSHSHDNETNPLTFYMKIVGSGAVDMSADPQIAAGTDKAVITLEGTSDTNTVTLENGTGLSMPYTFIIGNGDIITFVYNESTSTWVEVSRGKN